VKNLAIVIAVAYFAIISVTVGIYSRRKIKNVNDFTKASQGMSWLTLVFAFTLIPLGAGHTLSLWESAPAFGASVMWWGIITGGIFLPLMMLWFGPWVRQTGLNTIPEILEKMFGKTYGRLNASVNITTWTGIGAAEALATATAIYGLSGGAVPFVWCTLIALILIVLYVYFGGILQLAILNIVNAIVMVVGSYLGLFMLGGWLLANINGWEGVKAIYESAGQIGMLQTFNLGDSGMWFQVIIPVTVLHCAAGAVAQNMNSPFFAAKSDQDCRKGIFVGTFFNCMASCPWIVMALIAAIPAVSTILFPGADPDAKLAPVRLALEALPTPILGVMMISLLCATLSTGGATVMANANVLTNDIFKNALNPKMSDETKMKLMKINIPICALLFAIPAFLNAVIFPVFLWCFSFGIPVFVVYFMGLKFKVSKSAAWATTIVAFIVNFWWTFWTPSWATGPWSLNMYPVTVVSVVLGVILTIALPGGPPLLGKKNTLEGLKDAG
jgi:SSS family solute:Na+ symporter